MKINSLSFGRKESKIKHQGNTNLLDENSRPLLNRNSIIVTCDNKPYSGIAEGSNYKGRLICYLSYTDGKLIRSYDFIHDSEKEYTYHQVLNSQNSTITFKDSSKMSRENFYSYPPATTYIYSSNGKLSKIYKNPDAKYRNEPIYIFESDEDYFEQVKKDGKIKTILFKNIDEAKRLLKAEYNIDIDYFRDIKEAVVLFAALEDYSNLMTEGKTKTLFSELKIIHKSIKTKEGNDKKNVIANTTADSYYLPEEIDKNYTNRTLTLGDIDNFEASEFNRSEPYMEINTNYDLDNLQNDLTTDYIQGYHPFYLMKSIFVHEFAHILHLRNINAKEQLKLEYTNVQEYIASKVSTYAKENSFEFVAEYIAGRLAGKSYSNYVNKEYQKLKGPNIF